MACTRIHFLLVVCTFQLLTIIERQVFDFLGYMWAPILVNFFHIIFVIFGFFGAYQLSAKYIVTYSVWNVIFIGWNAFLVCFYLNVGVLDRESDLLNLGTGSYSWFLVNGYGCQATYSDNITAVDDPYRPRRPETVAGCLVDYSLVEVVHSAVQCILAVMGIVAALIVGRIFLEDDDRFHYMGNGGDGIKSHQDTVVHPMYVSYNSLPTSAGTLMRRSHATVSTSTLAKRNVVGPAATTTPIKATGSSRGSRVEIDCHKNFVNFNGNDNLLQGMHDANTATQRVEELPNYFPPAPICVSGGRRPKAGFQRSHQENPLKSMAKEDVSFYEGSEPVDDLIDLNQSTGHSTVQCPFQLQQKSIKNEEEADWENSYNRANMLVNQRLKRGLYKGSADYIPRSPILGGGGGGQQKRNQFAVRNANFCDQIRKVSVPNCNPVIEIEPHPGMWKPVKSQSASFGSNLGPHNEELAGDRSAKHQWWQNPDEHWAEGGSVMNRMANIGGVQRKMDEVLRKKKSLRPRSYCGSNCYYEFEPAEVNASHVQLTYK